MNHPLSIRTWTEPFPATKGVAVVFDVFRCSTTIHCLKQLGLGPVFVAPSLREADTDDRAHKMRVFSELSVEMECLERFDNSPLKASTSTWPENTSALVATTSGTPAMFAAKNFERVYVGSLVNFSALVAELSRYDGPITLIPACKPDWDHVEDEIACQAVATALEGFANIPDFVRQCGANAIERILASPRPKHLAKILATGTEDVKRALDVDSTDQVLALEFDNSVLAKVVKL